MFCSKKSLTLLALFLILLSTTGSDLHAQVRGRSRQASRRIAERSAGDNRHRAIARRSYDSRVVASLLSNSLFQALYLSHVHPNRLPVLPSVSQSLPSLSENRRSRKGDDPTAGRVDPVDRPGMGRPGKWSAHVSGIDPEILNRVASFDSHIVRHSEDLGIEPNLTRAIIYVESAGDPQAVSHRGARGLMQLMPDTAVRLGVRNSFDPVQNIRGGTRYLRTLLNQFHNVELALWGYNAGPGAVEQRVLPAETRRYIPEVLRVKAALDRIDGKSARVKTARN